MSLGFVRGNVCRPPSTFAPSPKSLCINSIPESLAKAMYKNNPKGFPDSSKHRIEGSIIRTKADDVMEKEMNRSKTDDTSSKIPEQLIHNFRIKGSHPNQIKSVDARSFQQDQQGGPGSLPQPHCQGTRPRHRVQEFRKIPSGFNKEMKIADQPHNQRKNRYRNNYPCNKTKFGPPAKANGDNDVFIYGYKTFNEFIASQGPKDFNTNTLGDFWRMIVENQCSVIVMIAKLTEGGRVKVAQYWPELVGNSFMYGLVEVTLTKYVECLDYCIRYFTVKMAGNMMAVQQYQFLAWPDHDVPQSPHSFAQLAHTLRRIPRTGPMVVHCSAGIGRTGTLILVLSLLDQLNGAGYIDAPTELIKHRTCRARLIENTIQYRFAHQLLLEMLFGQVTSFPKDQYEGILTAMHKKNPKVLQDQYQKLKELVKDLSYRWGENPVHQKLNRTQDILPVDGRQVFLQMVGGKGESQYINAVRVNGLRQRDAILVTEHPMIHTVHQPHSGFREIRINRSVFFNIYTHCAMAMCSYVIAGPEIQLNFITISQIKLHQAKTVCRITQVMIFLIINRNRVHNNADDNVEQSLTWKDIPEKLCSTKHLVFVVAQIHLPTNTSLALKNIITFTDAVISSNLAQILSFVHSRLRLRDTRRDIGLYKNIHEILFLKRYLV
ncbi:unnamed protein product, partial [Meganyctiphanes norvegica]